MDALAHDMCLRWLCEPAADPLHVAAARSELPRSATPFPPEAGDGWIEMLDLEMGAHLCRVVHQFAPGMTGLAPMAEVRAPLAEPLFFLQTTRMGGGVLLDRRLGRRLAHDSGTCIFEHLDRVDHQHWAEPRGNLEITALSLSHPRLQRTLGVGTTRALLVALGIAARPSAQVHPLPEALKAILESSLPAHLTGALRRLHAQARVLDFLVALVGHLQTTEQPAAHPRRRIERVREELEQMQGQVPCLDDLAQRHGFTVRAMNDQFKRAFGRSVFTYITDRRLDAAHVCLQATDLPLKVVATRLGYASVSHFSQAFTRKFGYRPGYLRRAAGRR